MTEVERVTVGNHDRSNTWTVSEHFLAVEYVARSAAQREAVRAKTPEIAA